MPAIAPPLLVEERHLSFGESPEDPAFLWVLPIQNTTEEDIKIDGFTASCSCAAIKPSSVTVPARGSAEVRLALDLRRPHGDPTIEPRGFMVHVEPRISNSVGGNQPGWVVHGKVLPI